MSWLGKRQAQGLLPVSQRWRQVHDAGEVVLEHFTQAELDCVALDPQSLPERERGPALQSVSPLLARLPAESRTAPAGETGRYAEMLGAAAARLEKRGFIRPGPPGPVAGTLADELGGVAADPANPGGVRQVTILGDLALITRMKSQPCWVAEALISPEPARSDPAAVDWRLAGRMYAAYRPSAALVEAPARPDGGLHPFRAFWQPNAARQVARWLGVEPAETADPARRAGLSSGGPVPAAEAAPEFASVHFLHVVHPVGQQVVIRSLMTAAAPGRIWLLEGERAVPVSIDQLAPRVDELVTPPDNAGHG
ncbi:MAG TPA: hypothetical protein VFQ44_01380 [Streptosporangiaceae bacterium]|nr:hypothetical protein [Streptosporangiaceae bacterium]